MSSRTMLFTAAALLLAVPFAHADEHAGGAVLTRPTTEGDILTNAQGMTLYTHTKDAAGISNCNDQCAKNWPPLTAPKGTAAAGDDYTLITRKDGAMQWAYGGMPLYLYAKDTKPGETSGAGAAGGTWHVAKE